MSRPAREAPSGSLMSRAELIGGFLYFPFYLVLLPWLVQLAVEGSGLSLSDAARSFLCCCLDFAAVVWIFHRWLAVSFAGAGRRFWETLQAAVLGFAFYYALFWLLSRLAGVLRLDIADPNGDYLRALSGGERALLWAGVLLLVPPVEETLFRGLIFAGLREKGRVLAYAVSALAFAAAHVWQYAGRLGWWGTLLAALVYLPAGIALGWTYEKSGSVVAPILVHALLNAISLDLIQF